MQAGAGVSEPIGARLYNLHRFHGPFGAYLIL